MNPNYYVVIMAGGIGSRFWPMSRQHYPKQFHDILGTGRTLLQQTADRYNQVCPPENIYIVTNKDYYGLVKEQLPFLSDHQILLEPIGRNTAPCVAYACQKIGSKNPNAAVVVAPSDHVILKEEAFARTVLEGLQIATDNNVLLTLGIKPSRPDTGYGYIRFQEDTLGNAHKVKTFTEKPNLELAKNFLKSGDYVWNAGIFIWSVSAIEAALKEHLSEMQEIFADGAPTYYTDEEAAFINVAYGQCKSISIDYGIMEKSNNVYTLLSEFGWSDLGTWKSLFDISPKDTNGNVINGTVMTYNTKNCIIKTTSNDKLIVVQGLDNYIVAESDGVFMVCHKDQEQMVKDFVTDTKATQDKKFS